MESNNRDTFDNRVNPLYKPLSINDGSETLTTMSPFEIYDAQMIIDENGNITKSKDQHYHNGTYINDMNHTITDNPNVFAKLSSDNINRRLINGSYIDGERILKIDRDAILLSKNDAEIQSEIKAINTTMANVLDEVAIDPSRITVQPSFNSSLPTYEIGINNQQDPSKQEDGYKIQDYESIYDDPNNSSKGYIIEDYKSIYDK